MQYINNLKSYGLDLEPTPEKYQLKCFAKLLFPELNSLTLWVIILS